MSKSWERDRVGTSNAGFVVGTLPINPDRRQDSQPRLNETRATKDCLLVLMKGHPGTGECLPLFWQLWSHLDPKEKGGGVTPESPIASVLDLLSTPQLNESSVSIDLASSMRV